MAPPGYCRGTLVCDCNVDLKDVDYCLCGDAGSDDGCCNMGCGSCADMGTACIDSPPASPTTPAPRPSLLSPPDPPSDLNVNSILAGLVVGAVGATMCVMTIHRRTDGRRKAAATTTARGSAAQADALRRRMSELGATNAHLKTEVDRLTLELSISRSQLKAARSAQGASEKAARAARGVSVGPSAAAPSDASMDLSHAPPPPPPPPAEVLVSQSVSRALAKLIQKRSRVTLSPPPSPPSTESAELAAPASLAPAPAPAMDPSVGTTTTVGTTSTILHVDSITFPPETTLETVAQGLPPSIELALAGGLRPEAQLWLSASARRTRIATDDGGVLQEPSYVPSIASDASPVLEGARAAAATPSASDLRREDLGEVPSVASSGLPGGTGVDVGGGGQTGAEGLEEDDSQREKWRASHTEAATAASCVIGWSLSELIAADVGRVVAHTILAPMQDAMSSAEDGADQGEVESWQMMFLKELVSGSDDGGAESSTASCDDAVHALLSTGSGSLITVLADVVTRSIEASFTKPTAHPNAAGAVGGQEATSEGVSSVSGSPSVLSSKFVGSSPESTVPELSFEQVPAIYRGLEALIGTAPHHSAAAVRREHCRSADSFLDFETGNYQVHTTSATEYDFVVEPSTHTHTNDPAANSRRHQKGDADADDDKAWWPRERVLVEAADASMRSRCRTPHTLASFAEARQGIDERLASVCTEPITDMELLTARLYTGPMFEKCAPSRSRAPDPPWKRPCAPHRTPCSSDRPRPATHADCAVLRGVLGKVPFLHRKFERLCHGNHYTGTIHTINAALIKLGRITTAQKLYRGVSGMRLPEQFLTADEFDVRGGVELGFLSATSQRSVALEYAASSGTGIVYEIQQSMGDRGADLSWLSQYPHEAEVCFPPVLGLEVLTRPDGTPAKRMEGAVVVVELRPSVASSTIRRRQRAAQRLADWALMRSCCGLSPSLAGTEQVARPPKRSATVSNADGASGTQDLAATRQVI